MKNIGLFIGVAALALASVAVAQNLTTARTLNFNEATEGGAVTDMGNRTVIGGDLDVVSGGQIDIETGGSLTQAGVPITLVSAGVEVVTATNVIAAAESGSTFFLNSGTEFASTLPPVAAGLRYTFIIAAAPVGASYTVGTDNGDNVLNIVAWAGGAADAADVATAQDVVTFVDGQAVVGDWLYCISDGTSWQCTGGAAVAAGLTTGAT